MYEEGYKIKNAPRLPLNMLDAIRYFEKSKVLPEMLGQEFCGAYAKLKFAEWNDYMHHFSEWERQNALDV